MGLFRGSPLRTGVRKVHSRAGASKTKYITNTAIVMSMIGNMRNMLISPQEVPEGLLFTFISTDPLQVIRFATRGRNLEIRFCQPATS
jgi:hypothetical protein